MSQGSEHLKAMKRRGDLITILTCYDYPTALIEDEAGVDVIFVGDSVGPNILGYESEKDVTMADMVHHLKAVRRGVKKAYLLADMPHQTYQTPAQAFENANALLSNGADGIKMERPVADMVRRLSGSQIDVWGHLGLTPQFDDQMGLRGKTHDEARQLIEDAMALEEAGIVALVLEMVPEEVARLVTDRLRIPTIGIGAGRRCDGQVQVIVDILGTVPPFRHTKRYLHHDADTLGAVTRYRDDVRQGRFPGEQQIRHMDKPELERLTQWADRTLRIRRVKSEGA